MNVEAILTNQIKTQIQFPVLLACSGGLDSMVLAQLLLAGGAQFHLGHVNYGLRGDASDGDEHFVRAFAMQHGIPLHVYKPNLNEQRRSKESIQMLARRIRYDWLEQIRIQEGLHAIVTAHHQRDQAETLLLNLSRSSGWRGAIAMKHKNGKILRPLLLVPHAQIKAFAVAQKLKWREDASNKSNHYKRNRIRNLVLPELEKINSDVLEHLSDFSRQIFLLAPLIEQTIRKQLEPYQIKSGFLANLKDHPQAEILVYEALKPYQLQQHTKRLLAENHNGAQYFGKTHQLLVHGAKWLIKPLEISTDEPIQIDLVDGKVIHWHHWSGQIQLIPYHQTIETSSQVLFLPLTFKTIIMRNWNKGDKIAPMGMKGNKKLSDIFIDAKINQWDKKSWPIICNAHNDLLWVPQLRVSRLAKINPNDSFVWSISLASNS